MSTLSAIGPTRVAYSNCPVANALLVASRTGKLERQGVLLSQIAFAQGATHFAYDHAAYTRFGGEIPPLVSEGLRAPGRTRLLGITVLKPRQGFYVHSAGKIASPSDLRGRRIGLSRAAQRILFGHLGEEYRNLGPWEQTLVALGSWEVRALKHTLAAGGLRLNDVIVEDVENPWVDVPRPKLDDSRDFSSRELFATAVEWQSQQLKSGQVDALFSWLPYAAELELQGVAKPVFALTGEENAWASVWTVSAALVERRPEIVQRLVDSVVEAASWATDHAKETIEIHALNLGVSVKAVETGFGEGFHRDLRPRLDQAALRILEQTQQFLFDHGLIDRLVDIERWAAPEFLDNASL
uniref:Thermophilic dibenzothiophene desulfurization enzyme B n=1 Tax=Paenibacillus sp. A11-2 TaxID=107035 RepID=Q9LBX3_9BACL|nr:thermophilic dibenzothiophene desulfurization enzyme B [Paenibacillus sp. A11-2]